MEYVITTDRPFDEIEALTVDALERQGLVVQRTFSLRSAVRAGGGERDGMQATNGNPGYSVLMLYASGGQRRPLGLLTLYQRGGRTVINPVLTPGEKGQSSSPGADDAAADAAANSAEADADAALVAALVLSGLEFCVDAPESQECIDPRQVAEETTYAGRLIQDPVCGKWIEYGQAEAGIEYEGIVYHVCCSLCREEFERDPGRYVRVG